jgi:hypothetical protein
MPHLAHVPETRVGADRPAWRAEPLWRAAALGLLALAAAWSFRSTFGNPDCQDLDFGSYYRAGVAVRRGETPYTVDAHGVLGAYPYAPVYAYLFAPLSCLDYLWACRVWMVLNWLATVGCFALALTLILGPGRTDRWAVALLAAVPTAGYLWANVRVGQVGALMLLGCLGWAVCRRRGWPFLGGLLLASACALKLAPGLLVPYLALRRDWRGLGGVLVGGLVLLLLPAAWVGWEGTLRLHREWIEHTSSTHVPEQTFRPGNQSLLAQLARLPVVSNGHILYSAENLEYLYHGYPWLVLALAGGLLCWIARASRRAEASAPEERRRENLHLVLLLMLLTLVHPRAWRCNYTALLLPCVLLADQVWRRRPAALLALAALAALALACGWPTRGVGEGGWNVGAWLLLGKHFWAAVAVACACCWCARRGERPATVGWRAARAGGEGAR